MEQTKDILKKAQIDERGREINDPNPLFHLMDEPSQEDSRQQMKDMIRNEFSRIAQLHGKETWEEANDFDVDDPFEIDVEDTKYMAEEWLKPRTDDDENHPLDDSVGEKSPKHVKTEQRTPALDSAVSAEESTNIT